MPSPPRFSGTVGGVIVVLLWFYVSGIAILTGAELNAEIEHASPYGKAPGQQNAKANCSSARAPNERSNSSSRLASRCPEPGSIESAVSAKPLVGRGGGRRDLDRDVVESAWRQPGAIRAGNI